MKVRKVVIPAAGFGTRFLPATKTLPKEMLPIVDKPVIQFIVEEAVKSGIEQVVLVTSTQKKPLEDFFDSNVELEKLLEQTGKSAQLEMVRQVTNLAEVVYVRQKAPRGNGDAVLVARPAVGDEPFLMQWGDDILLGVPPVPKQLIDVAERYDAPVLAVRRVGREDWTKYGMVEVEPVDGPVSRALSIIEKPKVDESPSDLAQIGGMVLTPDIFDLLATTSPGPYGELFLADALFHLVKQRPVYTYEFTGRRYDAGNKLEFLKATVELALQDPELGPPFAQYLSSLNL
jgi:UTP--glucose-1-phosphate uridylyltransferase